jgi:hypothetical protein
VAERGWASVGVGRQLGFPSHPALTPLKSPGWIQMFQTAWMPPGFIPPDDLDFEPATSMW